MAALAASLLVNPVGPGTALAAEGIPEADFCTFVVPTEFIPSEEPGIFVNRNRPMESSSIGYSIYYNGEDVVPTNRERQIEKNNPNKKPADESINLTKEMYEETVAAAYNSSFGEDVGYKVQSFESIKKDGYPGYRITATYQKSGEMTVHQTVIMMLSRYRTFTVTYQRAEDDYCEEAFEESIETIHVG